jgi:hypothetical protein
VEFHALAAPEGKLPYFEKEELYKGDDHFMGMDLLTCGYSAF